MIRRAVELLIVRRIDPLVLAGLGGLALRSLVARPLAMSQFAHHHRATFRLTGPSAVSRVVADGQSLEYPDHPAPADCPDRWVSRSHLVLADRLAYSMVEDAN